MTYQVIIAAPLLIAAILMAVRFVGCTQDFDQFDSGSPPYSYSDVVSKTDGLVSFWQLNDQSPPTAVDNQDGNNGTYQPGVSTHIAGLVSANAFEPFNFAAAFDGKTGYVKVPFAANLNPPIAFTVEALVKPSIFDTNTHVIVASDSGYRLALNGGSFEASVAAGTAGFQPPVVVFPGEQGVPYQDAPPYYVAMTYDGSTLGLYVNPAASDGEETFLKLRKPGQLAVQLRCHRLSASDEPRPADRRQRRWRHARRVLRWGDPRRGGVRQRAQLQGHRQPLLGLRHWSPGAWNLGNPTTAARIHLTEETIMESAELTKNNAVPEALTSRGFKILTFGR